jgi:hypothetical protein
MLASSKAQGLGSNPQPQGGPGGRESAGQPECTRQSRRPGVDLEGVATQRADPLDGALAAAPGRCRSTSRGVDQAAEGCAPTEVVSV